MGEEWKEVNTEEWQQMLKRIKSVFESLNEKAPFPAWQLPDLVQERLKEKVTWFTAKLETITNYRAREPFPFEIVVERDEVILVLPKYVFRVTYCALEVCAKFCYVHWLKVEEVRYEGKVPEKA